MPNTIEIDGVLRVLPLAASTTVKAGQIGCLNTSGYLVPASAATGLKPVGRIEESATCGTTAGEVKVAVKCGTFLLDNKSTDSLTLADIGNDCYFYGANEVGKTDGSDSGSSQPATRSAAGKVFNIDGGKVAVKFG